MMAKEAQIFDMTFPVEVSDGRCLTISWNHGADCHHVARVFAEAHGILPDELPTIEAFVNKATALTKVDETSCARTLSTADEAVSPEQGADENTASKDVPEVCDLAECPKDSVVDSSDAQLMDLNDTPQHDVEETIKENDTEGFEFVECVKSPAADADEPAQDNDISRTAAHLAEAGLGSVDVLMALLKTHNGSVQETLEELLNQP